jgi:hypothetical protein
MGGGGRWRALRGGYALARVGLYLIYKTPPADNFTEAVRRDLGTGFDEVWHVKLYFQRYQFPVVVGPARNTV